MSELRNYKATEKDLFRRLELLTTKTAIAHTDWRECYDGSGYYVAGVDNAIADRKLAAWNLAIERELQTQQALGYIKAIIKEMEGA